MAERLGKRDLDRLLVEAKADPAADRFVFDAVVPGLAVRVRGGRLAFVYQYKRHGTNRRVTLGAFGPFTLDRARALARELYAEVRSGGDPAGRRRAERVRGTTVAQAAEVYFADLEERALAGAKRGRLSTLAEFRRLFDRSLAPRLGRLPVADVELDQVEELHRALAATPGAANRALTLLSAVLGFAERRRMRPPGSNPCRLVTRFDEVGKRERLTLAEVARLGEALRAAERAGSANPSALLALRLLALTGMRRSEVLGQAVPARRLAEGNGLRWGDVDLADRAIHLHRAKAGPRDVPLGRAAAELLSRSRPATAGPGDPVCPGEIPGQPFSAIDKVRRRLYAAAGITGRDLHSLRHTFASVADDVGVPEAVVAVLLGHRAGGKHAMTRRYIHPDRDPLHQAADRVAATIAAHLAGMPPAAVVEFPVASAFAAAAQEVPS